MDPRYDEAYQRGFDGETVAPVPTSGPFFIPFLLIPPALFVGGVFGFVVAIALQALRAERHR